VATRNAFFKAITPLRRFPLLGCVLALATVFLAASGARAQAPDEAWRTLTTEHFRITFPESLATLGRRAGNRAEVAWAGLSKRFVKPPSGKIDVLLTDHIDATNGSAQVTPSDRIVIYARPPVDDPDLGYFDDWMEIVLTHELTHIFHLDETGALGSVLRAVFGRVDVTWPFFPDVGLPRWTTEGTAVWYESDLTHSGRDEGTYQEMQLRTAILEHRFERLDQASGNSPVWPGGDRAYVYGARFFRYLLDKYGDAKMGAFARAIAGQWVPYRLDAAGHAAFGTSISHEWRAWKDSLEHEYAHAHLDERLRAFGPLTPVERLSDGARYGENARISPDGKRLAYVWADGRFDTQIRVAAPDGSNPRELGRTNGLATFDWMPNGSILMSQLQMKDPYRAYEDLYVVFPDGHERRLTYHARLDHPSVAPGGRWAVAGQEGNGRAGLVRVDLATGAVHTICAPRLDTLWSFPRVSPDGKWIAATRWTPGAYSDVVVIDTACHVKLALTHDRAVDLAPAWTPDGRTLLWASDRSGISNILAADVDPQAGTAGPLRMVTNVETGVGYPSVDPSGRWLYLSEYHANGWDVGRMGLTPTQWRPAPPVAARFDAPPRSEAVQEAEAGEPVRPYSAAATLRPYYWAPTYAAAIRTGSVRTPTLFLRGRQVLGPSVGVETSGTDLVGRHSFDARARLFTNSGNRAAGSASYTYAGLGNPVFSAGVSQTWDEDGVRLGQQQQNAPYDTLFPLLRERSVGASVTLTHARWRRAFAVSLGESLVWDHLDLLDNSLQPSTTYRLTRPDTRLSDLRLTFQFTTARTHSFQIGESQGFSVLVRARTRKDLSVPDSLASHAGSDASLADVIGEVRAYRSLDGPGFAAHVLAVRGSFGYARGPGANAGWFSVGGASGKSETLSGLSLFGGTPLFFPVRGYPQTTRSGREAWSASAEYRFPLLLVDRGLGAWPLSLDRTMGTLFFDAGNAWGPELGISGYENPRQSTLASVGAELTADVLTFWTVALNVRVGVGVPLVQGNGAGFYLRLDVPF
jgi:Tol biopolymer transport system component